MLTGEALTSVGSEGLVISRAKRGKLFASEGQRLYVTNVSSLPTCAGPCLHSLEHLNALNDQRKDEPIAIDPMHYGLMKVAQEARK